MLRSFDDVSPITIRSNLKPPLHAEWSNSRKLLAIAGTKESSDQGSSQEYTNLLKFYSVNGTLVYTTEIPYTQVCPRSFSFISLMLQNYLFYDFPVRVSVPYRHWHGDITIGGSLWRPERASMLHGSPGDFLFWCNHVYTQIMRPTMSVILTEVMSIGMQSSSWIVLCRRVGSLQLLSRLAVRASLTRESSVQHLPLPPRLRASVAALFANTIR